MTEIAVPPGPVAAELAGPVTVFYPTPDPERLLKQGSMSLRVAPGAPPQRGNGRLVLISHGSGGSPVVHADLARALVEAGFVVAMPEHRADNYKDPSRPGPDSWTLRPAEMSRAIDAVAADARFAPLLALDKVGAYGMSAGGHTVLSLAGGRWSPAGFRTHCEANLLVDFQFCVGLTTQLNGGWLDGPKQWFASKVIALKFADAQPQSYADPRIAAAVAAVPAAADFDMASFAHPRMPLALVTARQDRWLNPQWHSDPVLKACGNGCEWLADLPLGGHGAFLSPLPPGLSGLLGDLLNDPPGFERAVLPEIDRKIADFFKRHLLN
ncbi:dienelactone hydrolase [Paucibacter oligotrophus]|uniref:Dienelactone hydrolase n=2 Tax=Roseateles oligotrophus TaxID=1769250 RepID=A0ABT2YKW1_9BURK|nr:dienelactone hydrolase [Roseateles oligotrophus]